MATKVLSRLSDGPVECRVEYDYDEFSDPNNWTLFRVRCVNGLTRPVSVVVQRGQGRSWWTVDVPAGEIREQVTGGPVRNVSDLPRLELKA